MVHEPYEKPAILESTPDPGGEVGYDLASIVTPTEWAVMAVAAGTWIYAVTRLPDNPSGRVAASKKPAAGLNAPPLHVVTLAGQPAA